MFDLRMLPLENASLNDQRSSKNNHGSDYNLALNKFRSAFTKGRVFRFLMRVLNHPQRLYDLNALKPELHVYGTSYSGIKVVPIYSIIGSEGRFTDFDMEFHPISEMVRERWVNMAIAYQSRVSLPPVWLIQIGDAYFVRDGHHRVSVSRAFGQTAIYAEVITWKASPPFPWQRDAATENSSLLETAHLST